MISPEPLVSSESFTAVDASESTVFCSTLPPIGVIVTFSPATKLGLVPVLVRPYCKTFS